MDNLNDLKAIWLTAKTESLPGSAEMEQIVKKFRNKKLRKITFMVFAALITVVMLILTMFIYRSTMVTTRIGEGMMIFGAAILVATNINSLHRFYNLKVCSNKEFIRFLEQTRRRQLFYYTKTQVVTMILFSAGLLLYIYEMLRGNVLLLIIMYSLSVIYFSVIWFIVRPKTFKREALKLNATMARLHSIAEQLENNSENE
jgi:hypothetical protein